MSARERLERACRKESAHALVLHADAADYLAGDLPPEQFLNTAYGYAQSRMKRERLQAEMWGEI